MKFKANYEPSNGSSIDQTGQKSKTVQSEKDSCDINLIMERFNRTGKLPNMQQAPARYGDARVVDFATAQAIVKEAQEQFSQLSANTRKAFGNSPQAFMESIQDDSEENVQKLLKLGILIPRKKTVEDVLQDIAINTKPKEIISEEKK